MAVETGTLTINKAENAPNMPGDTMAPAHSVKTVEELSLPDGWAWSSDDAVKELVDEQTVTATAVYIGADKGNYENESVEIGVTRVKCEHAYGEPAFTWKSDYSSAEAVFTCRQDNCGVQETVAAFVTSEDEDNLTVYTATVEFEGKTYTDTKTLIRQIPEDNSGSNTRLVIKEGIPEIPQALADTGYDTEEKIIEALSRVVLEEGGYTAENTVTYDIELQFSLDGGQTWITATEENFPAAGLTVTIPYPAGTTQTGYTFKAANMFTVTSVRLGTTAGDIEMPPVTNATEGIRFTVHGLSPVTIAWMKSEITTETPSTTETPTATETPTTTETTVTAAPASTENPTTTQADTDSAVSNDTQTGDNQPLLPVICLLFLTSIGFAVLAVIRARR